MSAAYATIIKTNLGQFYEQATPDTAGFLPARREGEAFVFRAFGEECRITPEGIWLGEAPETSARGVILSLYLLNARPDRCVLEPFRAFREFPDSMPYVGAFATHTEQILVAHTRAIRAKTAVIISRLDGDDGAGRSSGDFSFVIYPLPKIALNYIFYEADDDFPPSATCLYSSNAGLFLPVDGLADVGEYTSRAVLRLCE